MEDRLTFIYDGECPFCNHFAELIELKSKLSDISIINGREDLITIKRLLKEGYDLDKGAILLTNDNIFHGSDAINIITSQIKNPSGNLLKLLTIIFKSKKRTKLIFPFLLIARRFALISKGISTSIV